MATHDSRSGDELETIYDAFWSSLEEAVDDAAHGFHWPVVASTTRDGNPSARVVVLRAADRAGAWIRFHTDVRSPKVHEMTERPAVAVTLHDHDRKSQIRISGHAEIHTEDEHGQLAWETTGLGSRRCYLAPLAPSDTLAEWSANLPEDLIGSLPTRRRTEEGRTHFCAIRVHIEVMDMLQIRRDGHRRARFAIRDGTVHDCAWLAP